MEQQIKKIEIISEKKIQIIDLTGEINKIIQESKMKQGIVCVFTKHTTTALCVNEKEKRLLEDVQKKLEEIAPTKAKYLHDDIHLRECPVDEPLNGHAHLKALILNASESIPFEEGKLSLGKWQSVLFFDLDGPRKRELSIHIMGE